MILILMNSCLENWRKLRVKVKILCCNDANELEKQINEFTTDKAIIDIKYQSVGFYNQWNGNGVPANAVVNDRVLIMYDEEDPDYVVSRIKKGA